MGWSWTINDYFNEDFALRIRKAQCPADAVIASNSFAHIDDMDQVIKSVKLLLKERGVLLIEVHYVGSLIEDIQYDVIYHEHLNYYSMKALSRFFESFGMEIFDARRTPIHGGSMRYYVRNIGQGKDRVSGSVGDLRAYEESKKLESLSTYIEFAKKVQTSKRELVTTLAELKSANKRIIGYGASGRATTMMNYCGIDSTLLDYVVDDAPAKQGYFTPGNHLAIKPWSPIESTNVDYVLVFAWIFLEEIKKRRADYLRRGGKFIVPFPEVKIITD